MAISAKPTAAAATGAEPEEPSAVRGRRRVPAGLRAGAAARPVDTSPLRVSDPVRIGGYRVVARLGAGGMADVFYSVASTGRPVAVKVFRANGGRAAACHREYQLARAAGADCTAAALGYGTSAAVSYLAMAYLPGYRCGTSLSAGPPPALWLWRFGAALARVLTALHARGVVHCDVKPSNLLVRGDDVRVIDFGISRYAGEPLWDDQSVQCSPGWAAPEQLRAAPPTPAVDVFAWGGVLAYLASEVHPFAGRDGHEWYERVQSAEPHLLGLPPVLDEVVRWSLARSPRDRPTAAELTAICQARGGEQRPARATGRRWGSAIRLLSRPALRRTLSAPVDWNSHPAEGQVLAQASDRSC
jgi:serine/threonine protein kinase